MYGASTYGSAEYGGIAVLLRAISLFETITVSDVIKKEAQKTLEESVIINDSLDSFRLIIRTLSESITLDDVLIKEAQKTLTEAVSVTDTIIKQIEKELLEAVVVGDDFAKLVSVVREFRDTIVVNSLSREFLNGITAGRWTKQDVVSTIWTKEHKK